MMSIHSRSASAPLLAGLLLVAALAPASALAQGSSALNNSQTPAEARVLPPDPGNPTPPNTGLLFLLLFVFLGAAVGLSILPSQRTHQD